MVSLFLNSKQRRGFWCMGALLSGFMLISCNEPEVTIRLSKPVKARYMKFVALSEQARQPFAAVAELDVVETKIADSGSR